MRTSLLCLPILLVCHSIISDAKTTASPPIVVTTWAFVNATRNAFAKLMTPGATCLDAVEVGCRTCEDERCDGSVGWGSHPDEDGETTLDSLIMDGRTMSVGAVAKYIVFSIRFKIRKECSSVIFDIWVLIGKLIRSKKEAKLVVLKI
jgi:hypothetical protein